MMLYIDASTLMMHGNSCARWACGWRSRHALLHLERLPLLALALLPLQLL
jgi:hypothetical protein